MIQEQILESLNTLPTAAQQQVLDFIAFLQTRYMAPAHSETLTPVTNWHDAPFVGMWQDRENMQDSSAWVHTIRTQEWD